MDSEKEYELFRQLTEGEQRTKDATLTLPNGELNFRVVALDRHQRYEYLSQMSDDFMGSDSEIDIPDEAYDEEGNLDPDMEEEIISQSGLGFPDAKTVAAFETIVIKSLRHDVLVEDEIAELIRGPHVSDQVIFELGSEIIEYSMDMGEITEFRIN